MSLEPHLILQGVILQPSAEWALPVHGWTVARSVEGIGYWLQGGYAREFKVGESVAAAGRPGCTIRASSLGPLKLEYFLVHPEHLDGLLTVMEGHQLEQAGPPASSRAYFFTAQEAVSLKFARIAAQASRHSLPARAALLQLWAQAVAGAWTQHSTNESGQKLRDRFRKLLDQLPDAELAAHSLQELAAELCCSKRHFSRLFRQEIGVSLRARQTELRLQRARQLLAQTDTKILEVAQESGFPHPSLFNTMFKKRFGLAPSEWRRQNLASTNATANGNPEPCTVATADRSAAADSGRIASRDPIHHDS